MVKIKPLLFFSQIAREALLESASFILRNTYLHVPLLNVLDVICLRCLIPYVGEQRFWRANPFGLPYLTGFPLTKTRCHQNHKYSSTFVKNIRMASLKIFNYWSRVNDSTVLAHFHAGVRCEDNELVGVSRRRTIE